MQSRDISRRALLLGGAALVAAPLTSQGAPADPHYAVLSIIGDKLTMVGYRPGTGSHLDQNDHSVMPLAEPALDNDALLAVDNAIKRVQPSAVTTLLSAHDPNLYSLDEQSLEKSDAERRELLSKITELARQTNATRLVLVSKYSAEARFALAHSYIGSGKLAGLGFYTDRITRIRAAKDGQSGIGYLAPYAYLNFSLIDLQTMTVLGHQEETRSRLVPTAASKEATVPWDALTAGQKTEMLQALIRRAAQDAVPRLLAAA